MEKLLDRAPAMGYEICDLDDDLGQSVLVQQEQHTFWRENEQLFNTTEETVAEAKVWRKATTLECLVRDTHVRLKKKMLKTAASITIATWLDEIHELRRKIQRRQTESIIMSMTDPEELREADEQFKQK